MLQSIYSPKRVRSSTCPSRCEEKCGPKCYPRCTYKSVKGHMCPNYVKHTYNGQMVCNVHLNTLKANEECTICISPMTNPQERIKLTCGHYFHEECLSNCIKTECPICRREMQSMERQRVYIPKMAKAFAPVFAQSGSRQHATTEIIGGIVESIGGMGDEEFDVFRAHLQMLKFGMMTLKGVRLGSSASQVMYDWSMAMGAALNHLSMYGDYRGFVAEGRGSVFLWRSQNPALLRPQEQEAIFMEAPPPSPEPANVPHVFMRERSPSPVLPGYYH